MNSLTGELENSDISMNSVILKTNNREDTIVPLKPIFRNHDIESTQKHRRITSLKIFYVNSELHFDRIGTHLPSR